MHKGMTVFSVEVPVNDPKAMDEFQRFMDVVADETNIYIGNVAHQLGVSFNAAADIVYLRGRSRWTRDKEDYLIKLAKEGKPLPNICDDFEVPGTSEQSQGKVTLENLRMHCQGHDKQNSWWAKDAKGIELRRVCDKCEHLLVEEYSPAVLGFSSYQDVVYEDIVDEPIEEP
jgi:hypothetical protein